MKIELILLGVIGLVFLVDFIMNSRKKPSIDNVVDQIDGGEPVKTNNPLNYLLKRKKNFSLSIILILFSKLLAHFFVYTTVLNNGGIKPISGRVLRLKLGETRYRDYEAPLSYHIDNIFNEETWLFIPVTILLIFIAWFFNDKIKSR